MHNLRRALPLAVFLGCTACAPRFSESPVTQMEVRAIQTRDLDSANKSLVMKTMMNVLQDEGYIVKNAVLDLGLLSAEKQISIEKTSEVLMQYLLVGNGARWSKHQTLEASANISEFGSKIRVRINFQIKKFDNHGCVIDVFQVYDPAMYQEFFEKVSKGIFIQQEGL